MYNNSLAELRSRCVQQDIPLISTNTENFLRKWMSENRPHYIAEIWSASGYSSSVLARELEKYSPYGRIDSWEVSHPHYRESIHNTKAYHQVKTYLGNINYYNIENFWVQKYDLLFIDGRKSETVDYLRKWKWHIQDSTWIIIDDVIKYKEKMKNLYLLLDRNHIPYTCKQLDDDDGIILLQATQSLLQALSS